MRKSVTERTKMQTNMTTRTHLEKSMQIFAFTDLIVNVTDLDSIKLSNGFISA